jgi:RNA polymerase subunit RPABC4/transcription elongation factor Spt4
MARKDGVTDESRKVLAKCNCSETIECWPGIIVVKARDSDETPKRVGQIKWYRKPEFPMKARGLVWYKGDDSLSSI